VNPGLQEHKLIHQAKPIIRNEHWIIAFSDVAKQWRYRPTGRYQPAHLRGKAVPVVTVVEAPFVLPRPGFVEPL
jgi:hypothetical protein